MPEQGLYLWQWFQQISDSCQRIIEGICKPIPPSEFVAWQTMTGIVVNPVEYDILTTMDRVFCSETNIELQNARVRWEEKRKQEMDAAK